MTTGVEVTRVLWDFDFSVVESSSSQPEIRAMRGRRTIIGQAFDLLMSRSIAPLVFFG
jgi:hypothetical protein